MHPHVQYGWPMQLTHIYIPPKQCELARSNLSKGIRDRTPTKKPAEHHMPLVSESPSGFPSPHRDRFVSARERVKLFEALLCQAVPARPKRFLDPVPATFHAGLDVVMAGKTKDQEVLL